MPLSLAADGEPAREDHERGEPLWPDEGALHEAGRPQRHGPPAQPPGPTLPR